MTDTKDTHDDALVHFGVKGMQWGKHKAPSESSGDSAQRSGLTDGQKKALKYAAGGALIAGALITTAILAKNGKIPVGSFSNSSAKKLYPTMGEVIKSEAKASAKTTSKMKTAKDAASTAMAGKKVIDDLRASEVWQKKVSEFQDQINEAQKEQTKYMITDSAKSGIPYNAKVDNAYSPEARR